ncbi:MAG: exonuclease domain-containing protein [Oscillospiraceae bacterium]|nr:exonuclease domain-containing protein [Oscillospiraceae bacterium]
MNQRRIRRADRSNTNYIKQIVDDYCVLDTETTGLSAYYDEVIEIGILRVRDNTIVDRYSQLIQPEYEIDDFITELTGITNEMVEGMPTISEVKDSVLSFIGSDIIVGHNTSFDMRFLQAGFQQELDNQYMDTMQFARKLYPELKHHRLSDLTEYLGLSNNMHRSIADCIATKELYDAEKSLMAERGLRIEDLWASGGGHGIDIGSIMPTAEVNEDGFFYGRHVVFTGKLEKMLRKDAMQLVVNLGGVLDNTVTKKTNYLVLGNNDYNAILHGEKSSKHKKAEQLKLAGQDIEIIDELTFYDILKDEEIL